MNSTFFHVLLAEDDPDDRDFFVDALREVSGAVKLTMAEDGDQLMKRLTEPASALPDLLFMDLNMPRKNGLECLTEIKRIPSLRSLPVIILTTGKNSSEVDKLFTLGAHYYITKPNDFAHLVRLIDYILRLRAEEQLILPERKDFILNLETK